MTHFNCKNFSAFFISMTILLTGFPTASHAENPALDQITKIEPTKALQRPNNVPENYTITPFGYFHSSCVYAVGKKESVSTNGEITLADGSRKSIGCTHPHYTQSGERVEAIPKTGKQHLPTISGWIEASQAHMGQALSALTATWIVPTAPTLKSNQTIYFFPGLEDDRYAQTILQPVLGWNAFNDNNWSLASWNCCSNGAVSYSNPIAVSSGDQIKGTIQGNCAAGTVCSYWNVISQNITTGKSSILQNTSSYGQTFSWAFGGVLEVYSVNDCSNYPSDRTISFSNIALYDVNRKLITSPPWTSGVMSASSPQCGYSVATTPTLTRLTY